MSHFLNDHRKKMKMVLEDLEHMVSIGYARVDRWWADYEWYDDVPMLRAQVAAATLEERANFFMKYGEKTGHLFEDDSSGSESDEYDELW